MGILVQVGNHDDMANGTMKEVKVEGRRILLARVGDGYLAVQGRCPHMGGILSRGVLEGTVVTCPRHGSQFDLRDGQIVRWLKTSGPLLRLSNIIRSPRPLQTYNVQVENNKIMIEI